MPYVELFEPVVKPRENVRLVPPPERDTREYFQVQYIEPVYVYIHNFGTLAAGQKTNITEISDLDLYENELGQWRLLLLDDVEVTVRQPRGVERGTTKVVSTKVTPHLILIDRSLKSTEIYTFEDKYRVYLVVENPTNYTITPRILFFGWKFRLKPIPKPAKWTDIPIGVPSHE